MNPKYVGVRRPPVVVVLWFVFLNWVFGSDFLGWPLGNVLEEGLIDLTVTIMLYCIFFVVVHANHFVTSSIAYLLVHTVLFVSPDTLLVIVWPGYAHGLRWKVEYCPV